MRSQRPWYFRVLLAILCVALGYAIAYWMLRDTENIREKLQQTKLDNKELEIKLVGAQRELQVELATNNTLAKELASVQDENIKIKEDLFFYKNMVSKRPR